jgi:hypothetical protein
LRVKKIINIINHVKNLFKILKNKKYIFKWIFMNNLLLFLFLLFYITYIIIEKNNYKHYSENI